MLDYFTLSVSGLSFIGSQASSPRTAASPVSGNINVVWGPCLTLSIYVFLLWLARVRYVPWLFVVWIFASIFNHMVMRVWYFASDLDIHFAILGYSVWPILLFSIILILFRLPDWISIPIQVVALIWASFSSLLSYLLIFPSSPDIRHKFALLIPPILLMEVYLISVIPVRM